MPLPVVATHSAVADHRELEALAPWLGGRELVTWDMPGWGTGPVPPDAWSPSGALLELLDERGIERCVLLGSSYGGLVSAELALHAPERVAALALLAPALDLAAVPDAEMDAFDEAEEAAAAADDLAAFVEANVAFWAAGPRRAPDVVAPGIRAYLEETLARIWELQADVDLPQEGLEDGVAMRLHELTMPALVVVGDEDTTRLVACAEAYAAGMPQARLARLDGVAHLLALEAPERVGPELAELLRHVD